MGADRSLSASWAFDDGCPVAPVPWPVMRPARPGHTRAAGTHGKRTSEQRSQEKGPVVCLAFFSLLCCADQASALQSAPGRCTGSGKTGRASLPYPGPPRHRASGMTNSRNQLTVVSNYLLLFKLCKKLEQCYRRHLQHDDGDAHDGLASHRRKRTDLYRGWKHLLVRHRGDSARALDRAPILSRVWPPSRKLSLTGLMSPCVRPSSTCRAFAIAVSITSYERRNGGGHAASQIGVT
jgi:hypothetical protein